LIVVGSVEKTTQLQTPVALLDVCGHFLETVNYFFGEFKGFIVGMMDAKVGLEFYGVGDVL
jgi:hypothetical protein